MTLPLDPWPRALRRALTRALVLGAALAAVAALVGAEREDVVLAPLLGGVAAITTLLERARLPRPLATARRRAALAWGVAALWLAGSIVQVAYARAMSQGRGPEQAWGDAWSFLACSGASPLVLVAFHLLVTSWIPAIVLARVTAPRDLGRQVHRAAPRAAAWSAGLCMALIASLGSRIPAALDSCLLAGVLGAAAASAALVVLFLMDVLPARPAPTHPDRRGPPPAC